MESAASMTHHGMFLVFFGIFEGDYVLLQWPLPYVISNLIHFFKNCLKYINNLSKS